MEEEGRIEPVKWKGSPRKTRKTRGGRIESGKWKGSSRKTRGVRKNGG